MKKIFHEISPEELKELIKNAVTEALPELPQLSSEEELINVPEVCEMLKISRTTLHKYMSEGIIPVNKIAGRLFFIRQEIIDVIKNHKIKRHEK